MEISNEELIKAAKPLIDLLATNYKGTHTVVVVEEDYVEILRGVKGVVINNTANDEKANP